MNNTEIALNKTNLLNSTYKCRDCRDSGFIGIWKSTPYTKALYGDDRKLLFSAPCPYCSGNKDGIIYEMIERAGIPEQYKECRYKDFKWEIYKNKNNKTVNTANQKKHVDSIIKDFPLWADKGIGLYINSSLRGTGKTFLASCIGNEIIYKHQKGVRFLSACDLIEKVKNEDLFMSFKTCKVLILDDIGSKITAQEYVNDILFSLIEHRYQHKLVNICTSNIPLSDLLVDDRIISRLEKTTQNLPLPEYSVRHLEASTEKMELFNQLNLF
jgi:DNA replication protein DnaC